MTAHSWRPAQLEVRAGSDRLLRAGAPKPRQHDGNTRCAGFVIILLHGFQVRLIKMFGQATLLHAQSIARDDESQGCSNVCCNEFRNTVGTSRPSAIKYRCRFQTGGGVLDQNICTDTCPVSTMFRIYYSSHHHCKYGNDITVYPKRVLELIVTADVHHAHVVIQLVPCLDRCTSARFGCEASR